MNREQRFGWIELCLRTLGRFGVREKKALRSAFNVSEATLSRDQAAFVAALSDETGLRIDRGKLKLDDRDALALPSSTFMPDLNQWLQVMLGDKFTIFPEVARVPPGDHVIGTFVTAIQQHSALFLFYVSRSSQTPQWRAVSPHTIVHIAGRYHARCFDHARGRYSDFVLARVIGTNFDRADIPAYIDGREDHDWHEWVKLRVSMTDPATSPAAMLDYGITRTSDRILSVRKALAPYVTNHRYDGFEDLIEIQAFDQ